MSTAPRPQDDPQQAVNAYFNGLAAKDVSRIPWADHATLRTPLNPTGGESELIRGRKAILDFFAGILPALRSVKVVRRYAGEAGWVAAQAEIALANGKTLYPRCLPCPEWRNHRAAESLRFAFRCRLKLA